MRKVHLPDYARVDTATPELLMFKVLPKGASRLKAQEFKREMATEDGDITITLVTPYQLDVHDQKVYLTLVALMSQGFDEINNETTEVAEKKLWDTMMSQNLSTGFDIAPYRQTTAFEIAKSAGMSWGKDVPKRIHESLMRLSSVTARIQNRHRHMSSTMIGYTFDELTENINVAVSPLLARAILNGKRGVMPYRLSEMRQLKNQAANILHLIFSSRLYPTNTANLPFKMETMLRYVYGETEDPKTLWKRSQAIREAIAELGKLNDWSIYMPSDSNTANVARKNFKAMKRQMDEADRIHQELSEAHPSPRLEKAPR